MDWQRKVFLKLLTVVILLQLAATVLYLNRIYLGVRIIFPHQKGSISNHHFNASAGRGETEAHLGHLHCLVAGTDVTMTSQQNFSQCLCLPEWHGENCSKPRVVHGKEEIQQGGEGGQDDEDNVWGVTKGQSMRNSQIEEKLQNARNILNMEKIHDEEKEEAVAILQYDQGDQHEDKIEDYANAKAEGKFEDKENIDIEQKSHMDATYVEKIGNHRCLSEGTDIAKTHQSGMKACMCRWEWHGKH